MFPIELLPASEKDPVFSQFPKTFQAMHWHDDMFGIPKDAELLAKSVGCQRQAFRIKDRIYGLQCHLEMTKQYVIDMITEFEKELTPDLHVDSKQQLLSHDLQDINQKLFVLLDYLSAINS